MDVLTDPWGWWIAPFADNQFMRDALLAGILTVITTSLVGTWVVLRGMSFLGDALARDLPIQSGQCVLLPRAEIARKETAELLTQRGARVTDLPVYRTVPESISASVMDEMRHGVDAILFTSESTVRSFLDAVRVQLPAGAIPESARIACIGPVTASAARELGLRVDAVASVHTTTGLVESLTEAFSKGGALQ